MLNSLLTKRSLALLLEARDQGRFWKSLSSSPVSTKAIYSFHTKFCDWRFIHRARLNLTPLRGAISWCSNRNTTCRRCQLNKETLNHVINNCPTSRRSVIRRHDDVRDLIETSLPPNYTILKEQRFGNLQPDLIVQNEEKKTTRILDIKVSAELDETHVQHEMAMATKYEALRCAFNIYGHQTSVHTVQLGALGGIHRDTQNNLERLLKSRRKSNTLVRKLANQNVHHGRNIAVGHITGNIQTY